MLKISNIIFFCGILATTLSAAEPVAWTSKKQPVIQVAPEDAQKKASWQRRKKRKKFRLSKKTATRIALALGVTCVGIKFLLSDYLEDFIFCKFFEQYKKKHHAELSRDANGYDHYESTVADETFNPSDTQDLHAPDNVAQIKFGLKRLRYLQRDLNIDYDAEVHDFIQYLRSRACLARSKDRRQLIMAAKSMLGIGFLSYIDLGYGNIFAESSNWSQQLDTCGIEIVGRTWYFIKNYKDAFRKEEPGLKDTMVRALAHGVDHFIAKVCFTGKIEHICKDVWVGRCFSVTEQVNLKTFVTQFLQQISEDRAFGDIDDWDEEKTRAFLTEIQNRKAAIENIQDFNREKFNQEIIASCSGLSMKEESLKILRIAFGCEE